VQSLRRRPAAIGAGAISPLAFVSFTPSATVAFVTSPEFTFTLTSGTPLPAHVTFSYVALYDPTVSSNGWTTLSGPPTLSGGTSQSLDFTPEPQPMTFFAGKTYVFMFFDVPQVLAGPLPTVAPVPQSIGDVRTVGHGGSASAIAYDPDDKLAVIASQNQLFTLQGPSLPVQIPPTDPGNIGDLVYSRVQHAFFFSSSTSIYRATVGGTVTRVASGFGMITGLTVDASGTPYVVDFDHVATVAAGAPRTLTGAGSIGPPNGDTSGSAHITYDDADGNLYVTDPVNEVVDRVTKSGAVSVLAGACVQDTHSGGSAACYYGNIAGTGSAAKFGGLDAIVYDDASAKLYVSDPGNAELWSITTSGTATQVAGYGVAESVDGNGLNAFIAPQFLGAAPELGVVYIGEPSMESTAIATYATTGTPQPAYTPATRTFLTRSFPSQPNALAVAPDGSAWYVDGYSFNVGHVDLTAGVTEFTLGNSYRPGQWIAVDPAGNAWLSAAQFQQIVTAAAIVRVTPSGQQIDVPVSASSQQQPLPGISGLTIGPDGNPWFTEWDAFGSSVGVISATGTPTQYWLATGTFNTAPRPSAIVAGPDGDLWFATTTSGASGPAIGRMTTSGVNVAGTFAAPMSLFGLTVNPVDHTVWATDGNDTIAEFSSTGTLLMQQQLCTGCFTSPIAIAAAPNGSIWFTEENFSDVARIDANGTVTRYLLPQSRPGPSGIAVRADGKVWISAFEGAIYLLDPVAYEAGGLPHPTIASLQRATQGRGLSVQSRRAMPQAPWH
jgi:virginiamycin B lyase